MKSAWIRLVIMLSVLCFPLSNPLLFSQSEPGPFSLLEPENGSSVQSLALWLDWEDAPDADTYDLYFGTVPSPPLQASGLTESQYEISGLSCNTPYYWYVVAVNGYGTTFSSEFTFSTYAVPGSFQILSPEDTEDFFDVNVLLEWENLPEADFFRVYFDTAPSPILYADNVPIDHLEINNLLTGTTYHWKVEAVNGCGTSQTSEFSFTTPCIDRVGKWPYGPTDDIAVKGNYAYFGCGESLLIADISDRANPTIVNELMEISNVNVRTTAGNYLIDQQKLFRIYDITDPINPVQLGTFNDPGWVNDAVIVADRAYLADDYQGGFRILDISNPAAPHELGYLDTPGGCEDVAVSGDYAYIADGNQGLRIIDISDSTAPVETSSFPTSSSANGVAVQGNHAYIAALYSGLRVVDISDPYTPFEVGYYDPSTSYDDILLNGTIAYIVASESLEVIDITQPDNPIHVDSLPYAGVSGDLAMEGSYLYSATADSGIFILDITDPFSPTLISSYDCPSSTYYMDIDQNYAYLTGSDVQTIDVSDPADPFLVGVYSDTWYSGHIEILDSRAYIEAGYDGLRILDISTPTSLSELGSYVFADRVHDLAVAPGFAYLAVNNIGLRILDVSNPAVPFEVGFYNIPGVSPARVAKENQYVYIGYTSQGLRIVDVSDPSNPVEAGSYPAFDWSNFVEVSDGIVFAVNSDFMGGADYIKIIDVSDPANPLELSSIPYPGAQVDTLEVYGSYLIADASYPYWLTLYDISDLYSPQFIDSIFPGGYLFDMEVTGMNLYHPNGWDGMKVLELTDCCSSPPSPLTLATPSNGSTLQDCSLTLDWDKSTRVIDYDLYLDTVDPPVSLAGSNIPVSYYRASLNPGTTYYWKVIARNGCGTVESAVFSFTTTPVPDSYSLISPSDGAPGQPVELLLDWEDSAYATSYNLYLGTSPLPPLYQSGLTESQADITGLEVSTPYFWTVEAVNPCGTVSSTEFTFTTADLPVLTYSDHDLTDSCPCASQGGGNGIPEPGETIDLTVSLINSGTLDATGVSAVLTSTTPGVIITIHTAAFPDILIGMSETALTAYEVTLPSGSCFSTVDFDLNITSNESSWSDSFQILLGDRLEVLNEKFETWPPSGWDIYISGYGGWESTATTGLTNYAGGDGHASNVYASPFWGYAFSTLTTPLMDLTVFTQPFLSFMGAYDDSYSPYNDLFSVNISTSGGSFWSELFRWDEDHDPFGPGELVDFDLSSYVSYDSVKFQFTYSAPSGSDWIVMDNVRVYEESCTPCTPPNPGGFSLLSPPDTASDQFVNLTLDWEDSPDAISYTLYFDSVSPPALYQADLGDSFFDLTGLDPATNFFWKVESVNNCGTVESSSGTWSFATVNNPMEVPKGSVKVSKSGDDLAIIWSATCGTSDDYVIYEGDLDYLMSTGLYEYVAVDCSDEGGDLAETLTPAAGDTYYVLVPVLSSGYEGDYGFGRPRGDGTFCGIIDQIPGECP